MHLRNRKIIDYFLKVNEYVITREDLIAMERDICCRLSFDFTFSNTHDYLERYLQVTELLDDSEVREQALEILTTTLSDSELLDYCQSQVAAAALILGYNSSRMDELVNYQRRHSVPKKDRERYSELSSFFRKSDSGDQPTEYLNNDL